MLDYNKLMTDTSVAKQTEAYLPFNCPTADYSLLRPPLAQRPVKLLGRHCFGLTRGLQIRSLCSRAHVPIRTVCVYSPSVRTLYDCIVCDVEYMYHPICSERHSVTVVTLSSKWQESVL